MADVLNEIVVSMGPDEWGTELMVAKAEQVFAKHFDKHPLVVRVNEHAGWWLQFAWNPLEKRVVIVGTANDAAQFSGWAKQFRDGHRNCRVNVLFNVAV